MDWTELSGRRNPCQHGTCVNQDDGYKCTCSPGWTGKNCQQAKKRTAYEKLGNAEYKIFAEEKTYSEAQQTCASDGGRLAMIKTEAVFSFLVRLIRRVDGLKDYWFGLDDMAVEGQWTWSDGAPLISRSNWAWGEPNNQGDQDCASLWAARKFQWDDNGCDVKTYFICQKGSTSRRHTYKSLGCFEYKRAPDIVDLEKTDPLLNDNKGWRTDAIEKCFQVALSGGFNVFALQFHGACSGSASGPTVYTKNGPSRYGCDKDGKGGVFASEVYQISATGLTPLDADMKCQNGWKFHDNYCYKTVNDMVKWREAEDRCAQESAHLVSIGSQEENTFVRSQGTCGNCYVAWIGLEWRNTHWKWTDGSTLEYKNWNQEPWTMQYCVTIDLVGVPTLS
ncbi:C-type mannose receptor 2-like [Branchiostoma floridae x Branchiostoma belcheri]